MESWSDTTVSNLQWWLGWIAVVGIVIGLLSAIGTMLVSKEANRRQSARDSNTITRLDSTESLLQDAEGSLNAAVERVAKLEESQKARRIIESDWPRLIAAADFPDGLSAVVNGVTSDPEREQLATDMEKFLQAAGVETMLNLPLIGGDLSQPPFTPSAPVQRRLQRPRAKSKFLAVRRPRPIPIHQALHRTRCRIHHREQSPTLLPLPPTPHGPHPALRL
jgi:hypothetical protein